MERARIVLLASQGLPAAQIAERVGCSRPTVLLWRDRYARAGLPGLEDEPRPGRPRRLPPRLEERIIATTLAGPPKSLGVTHWSSRLLGRRLGVSHVTVTRVWRAYGLKPHRTETFKFCTDPDLEWKIEDVVGLYLNPPEGAVVVCVDEKSQMQALSGPSRSCPFAPAFLSGRPTTTAAMAPPPCSPPWRWPPDGSPTGPSTGTATRSSWPS